MRKVYEVSLLLIVLALLCMAATHIGANLDVAAPTQVFTTMQSIPAYSVVHTSGSPYSLTGLTGYYWNNTSGAFGWQLDAPVLGKQYCFGNFVAKSGILTITSTTSVFIAYQGANGTVTTGTLVSGGNLGDFICMVGVDTTHYMALGTGNGSWTNN